MSYTRREASKVPLPERIQGILDALQKIGPSPYPTVAILNFCGIVGEPAHPTRSSFTIVKGSYRPSQFGTLTTVSGKIATIQLVDPIECHVT